MTSTYPVHYSVEHPPHFSRVGLLVRVVAFIALGMIGLSFGAIFSFAFLMLPVIAACRLAGGRDPQAYRREDGPRIMGALRWLAAISAWASLTAERLPGSSADEIVRLELALEDAPPRATTPGSAIWRVITGIPSAIVLAVLGWIGMFVWAWAALSILLWERVGPGAFGYLVGLQRWSIRLLAYQASLVDEYPPFSLSEAAQPLPTARAIG